MPGDAAPKLSFLLTSLNYFSLDKAVLPHLPHISACCLKARVGYDFPFLPRTCTIRSFPFCQSFRFIYGNKSAPGCAYQKWVEDEQGLGMPRLRHLWPGGKRLIHPESKAVSPVCEVGREGVGLQPGALRMAQWVPQLPLLWGFTLKNSRAFSYIDLWIPHKQPEGGACAGTCWGGNR